METIVKVICITFGIFIFISAILEMIVDIKEIMKTNKLTKEIEEENRVLDIKIKKQEEMIKAIIRSQKEMLEKKNNGNKETED